MSRHFHACIFCYKNHLGNQVVHQLARFAWSIGGLTIWWRIMPDFINAYVWNDAKLLKLDS